MTPRIIKKKQKVEMSTYLILVAMASWVIWGAFWALPLKLKLLKIHGMDKTNDYLIELAKQGDPDAKRLRRRGHILLTVGILGGFIIVFSKYF